MDLKLSLTASIILTQTKQIHPQSKEQFFSIKKSSRRINGSQILQRETHTQKRNDQQNPSQWQIIKRLQNLDVKQLHYSLAQTEDPDVLLQFKTKQPKKKKLPSKIYSTDLNKKVSVEKRIQMVSIQKKFPKTSKISNSIVVQPQEQQQKTISKQLSSSENRTQNKQKIQFYQPKKIISRTITSLFSDKVPITKQQQIPDVSINDFHIIEQIGDGTYSKVYKAVHKKSGFLCALKILQKKLMRQLKVQQNAIRQIKILSCLSSHPNITTLYGSFTDKQKIYLILEICTDGDLNKKMKKDKKTSISNENSKSINKKQIELKQMKQLVQTLRQICSALKELHQNSIMHRDIKPDNILVTMGNNIKLSDFGWSVHNPKNNLRKTLCGTPLYLAPQFITTCKYNDAVDIWSLGIMTYELLTGQFPFKIISVNDLVKIAQDKINFDKISCQIARDFCSKALIRDRYERADIWDLLEHQLFIKYKSIE